MKKRRPTIPFSEWLFAVDLSETRAIQNQAGMPAVGCACDLCCEWRSGFQNILPEALIAQMQRIGIQVAHPTDLYGSFELDEDRLIRVMFHFVGKVLSGPDHTTHCSRLDDSIMNYVPIGEAPWLNIRVLSQRESFESAPYRKDGSHDDVVCVDMRLSYPKSAAQVAQN